MSEEKFQKEYIDFVKNMSQLISLYRQSEDYFFRGIALKSLDIEDSAHAYMTGGAELNFIYITKNTNALDKILIQGRKFFDQHNLSFDVMIPEEWCISDTKDILNTMGYIQKNKTVSMFLDLNSTTTDQSAYFDSETIIKSNDDKLNEWMMPFIGAFESTFEICKLYAIIHESALKRNINLRHFSLYKQEKPIASSTLSIYNDTIARIDDVGTLPELQGKGYASALMRYILSEAKKLGAYYCFLESSDSGLGVYQKLGFKTLFKNNIYSIKP